MTSAAGTGLNQWSHLWFTQDWIRAALRWLVFQPTPSAGWVCSECCGTHGVFFPETPPCVATSSTTALVEDGAADWVQACSTCLSLSPWSGTTIPRQRTAACFNSWHCHGDDCDQQPPTPLSFRRLVFPPLVTGLSLLLQLGCGTACQSRLYQQQFAQHVQAAAENWTFHSLLRSVFFLCTQTFCIILSYCCTTRFTFLLVKCPSSLWTQCHCLSFV